MLASNGSFNRGKRRTAIRVCRHRGSKEIGGNCVEIEAEGKRIVLDAGLPLERDEAGEPDSPPVKGFHEADDSFLGLVISHPHLDHYGLLSQIRQTIPVYIGKAANAILQASSLFCPSGVCLEPAGFLADRRPLKLGPFTITPYLMDHSAYDTYALLVEAGGKKLFYTADFRGHGRKGKLLDKLIADPPKNLDLLLMEGTRVGKTDSISLSEDDLVHQFVELFSKANGLPLVWVSGQNIDRIVTIFKACQATGKQLIIDMYTGEILRAIGNPKLPQAGWKNIRVFLPYSQKRQITYKKCFDVTERYKAQRIYPESLRTQSAQSVMLFRPSMNRDLEMADCLTHSQLVCSVWAGYLKDPNNRWFTDWLDRNQLPVHHIHVSGHATLADLSRLHSAFPGAKVTPMHLDNREAFKKHFPSADLKKDGEWWAV